MGNMTMHGTVSFWQTLQWDRARKAATGTSRKHQALGFRHFIRSPRKYQRFRLDGVPFDPSDDAMWKRAEALMKKLADAIWCAPPPQGCDHDGLENALNRNLPSGYTYFLQLMAHDLVHSSIMLSRNGSQLTGLANTRRLPLRLDTVYGGGPLVCPNAYKKDKETGFRARLRLGRIRENGTDYKDNKGPELDIPRARATESLCEPTYPEPLIGDPRNDSHAIISQMVVLAHHVHNAILRDAMRACTEPTGSKFTRTQRAFLAAQATCILLYRELIQTCLLPKILHPDVEQAYRLNHVPVLDRIKDLNQQRWRAPLEFTFGFFRFGHSMIRQHYQFNRRFDDFLASILNQSSERRPEQMPFERKWTVDWRYFFSHDLYTDNLRNNFSVRIGPWGRQPPGDDVTEDSAGLLVFRDLVSSIATRPWSIAGLVDQIWPTHGSLLNKSDLFQRDRPNQRPWAKFIADWLNELKAKKPDLALSPEDIKTLSEDPPIPFFVRYEAYHEAEGKHLGILGSIVMADILYGILRHDRVLGIQSIGGLKEQLSTLGELLFNNTSILVPWSQPQTFAALFATLGITLPMEAESISSMFNQQQ